MVLIRVTQGNFPKMPYATQFCNSMDSNSHPFALQVRKFKSFHFWWAICFCCVEEREDFTSTTWTATRVRLKTHQKPECTVKCSIIIQICPNVSTLVFLIRTFNLEEVMELLKRFDEYFFPKASNSPWQSTTHTTKTSSQSLQVWFMHNAS